MVWFAHFSLFAMVSSETGVEERLCEFFVTKYEQYLDMEQLKQYQISLSADGTLVALGTGRHLIVTDDRAVVYVQYEIWGARTRHGITSGVMKCG